MAVSQLLRRNNYELYCRSITSDDFISPSIVKTYHQEVLKKDFAPSETAIIGQIQCTGSGLFDITFTSKVKTDIDPGEEMIFSIFRNSTRLTTTGVGLEGLPTPPALNDVFIPVSMSWIDDTTEIDPVYRVEVYCACLGTGNNINQVAAFPEANGVFIVRQSLHSVTVPPIIPP